MTNERRLHIALGSTISRPGRWRDNCAEIAAFAARAGDDGVDVLLTPELSACGYGNYDDVLSTAEPAGTGPIYTALAESAARHHVVICAGFVETAGSKRYLSHYVIWPDGHFIVQRKHRVTLAERPLDPGVDLIPPDYVHAPPADPMDPGQPRTLDFRFFEIRGVRCGIAICADGGIRALHEHFVSEHVDVLMNPAGAGGTREGRVTSAELATPEGRQAYCRLLEQVFYPGQRISDCIEYGLSYAAVNQCGFDGRRHYHVGHGMIVNAMGETVGFFHGIPNLDRQRPMYTHAVIDPQDRVGSRRRGQP